MSVHSSLFPSAGTASTARIDASSKIPIPLVILNQLGIRSIEKSGQMLEALKVPHKAHDETVLKSFMKKYSTTPDALNFYDSLVDTDGEIHLDHVEEENDQYYGIDGRKIDVQSKIHTASFSGGVLAKSKDSESIHSLAIETLTALIGLASMNPCSHKRKNSPISFQGYRLLSFKKVFH